MEELLVLEGQPIFYGMELVVNDPKAKRLLSYTRYGKLSVEEIAGYLGLSIEEVRELLEE